MNANAHARACKCICHCMTFRNQGGKEGGTQHASSTCCTPSCRRGRFLLRAETVVAWKSGKLAQLINPHVELHQPSVGTGFTSVEGRVSANQSRRCAVEVLRTGIHVVIACSRAHTTSTNPQLTAMSSCRFFSITRWPGARANPHGSRNSNG
jgi:hypothetical protein